jgi:Cdc6-like AAA superfamily ATPase
MTLLKHPDWTENNQDWLNHRIADTINLTLEEIWRLVPYDNESVAGDVAPFTILLDGAWGSGKSSIFRMIKKRLSDNKEKRSSSIFRKIKKKRSGNQEESNSKKRPIVVQINAWRHQTAGPLWYTTLEFIRKEVGREEGVWTAFWMLFRDRVQFVLVPFIGEIWPLLLVMVVFFLAWPWNEMDPIIKGFAFLASIAAILQTVIQAWRLNNSGPGNVNRMVLRMLRNPEQQVRDFFNIELQRRRTRPVVVMIDELDRCEPKIVVELLAALQNLMQDRRLVYLVAADRRWLRRCIEIHYSELRDGSPLADGNVGEAFLSKVFQLVATVPRVTEESIRYYAKCRLAGHEQEREDQQEAPKPNINEVHGWMNEAMNVAAPLLSGNPRLVNRYYFDLWFRVQRQRLLKLTLDQETMNKLGAASLVRVRWPALADFMVDHPSTAINGLIVLKRTPGWMPVAVDEAPHWPEPMAGIFASTDWLAFCLSPLMPRRMSELVKMVTAG